MALSHSGIRWPSRYDRIPSRRRRPRPPPSELSVQPAIMELSSRLPPSPGPLEPRDAEFAAQIGEPLRVERADDIDDGQLPRFGCDDHDAAQFSAAAVFEIYVHVFAVLGSDAHQPSARRALQLAAHSLDIGHAVFAFVPEFEAPDVDTFQTGDQFADIRIVIVFIVDEFARKLQKGLVTGR